jgi:hypothetical protein
MDEALFDLGNSNPDFQVIEKIKAEVITRAGGSAVRCIPWSLSVMQWISCSIR